MLEIDFDTIVVGAGLAGACAALFLSRHGRVLVLEAGDVCSGATGASAGLVNPLMGRNARPVDDIDASLDALHRVLDLADASHIFQGVGVMRPALTEKQAMRFQEVASEHPDHAEWIPAEEALECYPDVAASRGALLVRQGGWLNPDDFVRSLLAQAERDGTSIRTRSRMVDWGESRDAAYVTLEGSGERIAAHRIVLALGAGALAFGALSPLALRGVKGQTVRVRRPEGIGALPTLSGSGYLVPDGKHLILGSTYEHDYEDTRPSDEQSRYIIEKTSRMVPALGGAEVVDASAGVRVYAGHHGKPYLDILPGYEHVWAFTGLGSRGLLTAPRLARETFGHL